MTFDRIYLRVMDVKLLLLIYLHRKRDFGGALSFDKVTPRVHVGQAWSGLFFVIGLPLGTSALVAEFDGFVDLCDSFIGQLLVDIF